MELARYRPFEPDLSDCAFIRSALPFAAALTPQNRKEVRWYLSVTAARHASEAMQADAPARARARA